MFDLSPIAATAIMFGGMILLMVLGMPLAFALGTMTTLSAFLLWGPAALEMIVLSSLHVFSQITLVALPNAPDQ